MADTFQWSLSKRVYKWTSNGREVSVARLRDWVAQLVSETRSDLRKIGKQLISGEINRAEWTIRIGETLKNEHRALAMLAQGGKDQMDASTWGRLGQRLQSELRYFNSFASQIDNVELDTLGNQFLNRVESYADAGRFTYERAVRAREVDAGGMLEQNVLGDSKETCAECQAETDKGWVAAGELSEPGNRECQNGCNCEIDFLAREAVNAEEEAA